MTTAVDAARPQNTATTTVYPVILSGGAGTRLWPLSRKAYPKQFLALTSERSMIQETALRTMAIAGFAEPIVVCNADHRFVIEEQLAGIGTKAKALIVEPIGRNTGPAVAAAAIWLIQRDPEAIMLVQPSDHVISAPETFRRAVAEGMKAVVAGQLVTFGIKPTRPETGFGYIQSGASLAGVEGVRAVGRFVEKPDSITARGYVDSGEFMWNSGIFLMRARDFLSELERLNPAMWSGCQRAVEAGVWTDPCLNLSAAEFIAAPPLSIDRAVMEQTDRAAVVPVDMGWHDVGSWRAMRDVNQADLDGNVVHGDVVLDSVYNSYVRSEDRLVAVIGIENVVVVSTDDAVLVSSVDRAADVSTMVERLRHAKREEPLHHTTVHRPWGHYRTVEAGERFQVKRIMVKPGARLSLQKHFHRSEHWTVVQGTAIAYCGGETRLMGENESIYIPVGAEHRLENPGRVPLQLIEVQCGGYLGEDDIVRLADNYGRT